MLVHLLNIGYTDCRPFPPPRLNLLSFYFCAFVFVFFGRGKVYRPWEVFHLLKHLLRGSLAARDTTISVFGRTSRSLALARPSLAHPSLARSLARSLALSLALALACSPLRALRNNMVLHDVFYYVMSEYHVLDLI